MESITEVTANAFKGDLLERLSTQIHESPNATRRGVEQAVPISIAGLASHASSKQGAEQLLGAFRGGDYPHADARQIAETALDPDATSRLARSGTGFLSQIFGTRLPGVVDTLAGQSGVSKTSAATLLGLAAPLVLDAVGKEAGSRRLDARGLSSFLADQGRKASDALPPSVSNMLGVGALEREQRGRGAAESAEQRAREVAADMRRKMRGGTADDVRYREPVGAARTGEVVRRHEPKRRTGLWIAAALGVLALLALWFARRSQAPTLPEPDINLPRPSATAPEVEPPTVPTPEPQQPVAPQQAQPAVPPTPEPAPLAEPAPTPEPALQAEPPAVPAEPVPAVLSVTTGAAALGTFLDGNVPTPQTFALEGIEFSTASAQVSGNPMLDEVAVKLNEHENAQVRIEGHTDATGDPEMNQQLSEQRAEAVKTYLVAQGVADGRIETAGRGADSPAAPNDTPEGRAENRRVDLIVLQR